MRRRLHLIVVAAAAGASAMPATVLATLSPSFATETTTTTTTTAPQLVARATTTTTTTAPVVVTPTTTTTTTTAPVIVNPTPETTMPPVLVAPTVTDPIDDVVQATVAPDGDGSDVPLGTIDTSGLVPDDLDLSAFPGAPAAPPAIGDGPTFAAGFSCAYQCIESGVAYPRGFGALLVVATHVPARLFLSVVDADSNVVGATDSGTVTEFSWALDHLDPGQTYYAMVAATDENDDTSYAWGEFTTLSERTVHVTVGDVAVQGGPQNVVDTAVYLRVDGHDFWIVETGTDVGSVYAGLGRHVDVELFTFREWETSQYTFCEGVNPNFLPPQGDSDDMCGSWNSALLDDVDVDVIPAGRDRWTSVTLDAALTTSSGAGDLPDSYGDPRLFHFTAPVTLDVSYG